MSQVLRKDRLAILILSAAATVGCGSEAQPFALQFAATVNGAAVSCAQEIRGLGPAGQHSIGVGDLRFYVSNLQFKNSAGEPVVMTLDDNEFQLNHTSGSVALIDLTSNTEGSCKPSAIDSSEGTARTNSTLRGTTRIDEVAAISFDIGVPQAVMKSVIAANTPESAPSPLNEMYWNWASGYRHLVFNFVARDAMNNTGGGYLHIGSRNCGPQGGRALTDRPACEFVNTPKFVAAKFNLNTDKVTLDLGAMLNGIDFVAPIYDPKTFEVIGQGIGAQCHSGPTTTDCMSVFPNLGVNLATGAAQPAGNQVFVVR